MIHPHCQKTNHQWGTWHLRQDPINPPEDGFWYECSCQVLGCDAVQLAESLVPHGKSAVQDLDPDGTMLRLALDDLREKSKETP